MSDPKIVVTNYGTGPNSVLLVNRSILEGVRENGLLAEGGDLTWKHGCNQGYNPVEEFKHLVEVNGPPDVLIGQACVALEVFRWAAEHCPGTMRVLQRDSTHALEYQALNNGEYQRLGMRKRVDESLVRRECEEYDLAHVITVLSHWVERTFHKHGCGDKTRYVSPQVIELHRWQPRPRPWDGIAFRVMMSGPMIVSKGAVALLRAWRKMRPAADEQLCFSGFILGPNQGQEEHDLMQAEYRKTAQRCNVKMLGWTHDGLDGMPERYAKIDVYCLPSIQEGSTMTGLEAPAMGKAMVLTENCGSDLLEAHNGEIGIMIPAGDEDALADALDVYRRDIGRAVEDGKRGRKVVDELGGCERYGRDFARVMREEWAKFKA